MISISGTLTTIIRKLLSILFVIIPSWGNAGEAPLCVLNPSEMQEEWKPGAEISRELGSSPWSDSEAKDVRVAIKTGVTEMVDFFNANPSSVEYLWDDAIESLVNVTYASANAPEVDANAIHAARKHLVQLSTRYIAKSPKKVDCDEIDLVLPLTIFTYQLAPDESAWIDSMVKATNTAMQDCGSLTEIIDMDYRTVLEQKHPDPEDLFDLIIWSIWFTDAAIYPDIELPAEAYKLPSILWAYLEGYKFVQSEDLKDNYSLELFVDSADLAAHFAHIPTGVHRYPLYVEDSPLLYRYHRENFYLVMQYADRDTFASMVDTLRQYGCTPMNDIQVRDGTRYLLKSFHENGNSWLPNSDTSLFNDELDDYDIVHGPWTAVLGIRERNIQAPKAGTYGGIVRAWLPNLVVED